MYSSLTHHALYRRCIPALTMTVARRGTPSARVCGNNQKRCHRVFTAFMVRGFVPHSRPSGAMVEEAGY
ncbi:hypothetical protein ACQ48B_004832 [Escherichia coli O9,30:H25]